MFRTSAPFVPGIQPQSRTFGHGGGPPPSNWWEAGGATGVIAAWQPKGAASYTASKVNLANPGTNDALDVTAPSWNSTDGWVFNGTSSVLDSTVVPTPTMTVAVQFTDYVVSGNNLLYGSIEFVPGLLRTDNGIFGGQYLMCGTSLGSASTPVSANYIATFGDSLYVNGSLIGGIGSVPSGAAAAMAIGARYFSGYNAFAPVKIQAMAIYSGTLSSGVSAALAAAMAAI